MFVLVKPENIDDILSFRTEETASIFKHHLDERQLGVFVYSDGKAVGHGWVIINRGDSTIWAKRYFRLEPRAALVHFCSVDENYRGRGIYPALLCELYRRTFATGLVDKIYIDTGLDNLAARNAIRRTARYLKNAYYLRFLSHSIELRWPWKSR